MTKLKGSSVFIILALLLGGLFNFAHAAPDAPPMPSSFYGEIHFASGDGEPVAGDYIEAYVPGISNYVARKAITLNGGNLVYAINVPGDDPDVAGKDGGAEGDLVTFKIASRTVATGIWHGGTNVNLVIHPPKSIPGGPYYGNTNSPINLSGSSTDLGVDVSTYFWSNYAGINVTGQNYTYTQNCPEYSTCGGDATWYLKVTDAQGGEGRLDFHVIVNNTPWAYDQSVTTDEDTNKAITLTGFDPENGYNITYEIVAGPTHGTLSGTPPEVTYIPASDYAGPDSFTYHTIDDKSAASPTHTVSITVNAVNDPPVLNLIGNKTVNELVELAFTATATDVDVPANTLTFSLVGAPGGATITAGGAFSWTPSEIQGAGSYPLTVKVCDNGTPALCDDEAITVTVDEVNVAPVLGTIGNKTVDEAVELTFTATATDADVPANMLTFSLVGAPGGATITAGGVFSWTPTKDQGPKDYTFQVKVCDNGSPTLCDEEEITVTVYDTVATQTIDLVAGWNLVSFNLRPVSTAPADVLSSIAGKYILVYAWDATGGHSGSGNWMKYVPGGLPAGNTLGNLNEKMGFWIQMTEAGTLVIDGTHPTTTNIDILNDAGGWNLIGYPSASSAALPGALSALGTDYTLVYAYHPVDTTDPWKLFDRVAPDYVNDLNQMSPGWGYWIFITVDHTWPVAY